jgi:tetratricopeptide (TPR) repeat protein
LDDRSLAKAYSMLARPAAGTDAERKRARALLADAYHRNTLPAHQTASPFVTLDAIPDSLARTPIVGDARMAAGFALLTKARFDEAIAALRQPGGTSPADADDPLVHFLRGQQDERASNVASARRHYEEALTGALIGRSGLYVAIARLAQVEGDPVAAVDALVTAVRLNPNDAYLHKELAAALASQGRIDDAFCELMATLLIDPADAHAHATIGNLFLDAERHHDAVLAFHRALELEPDAYEVRYPLASALTRLGRAAEAAQQLKQFERARLDAEERRRRDIASDVEPPAMRPARPAGQEGIR